MLEALGSETAEVLSGNGRWDGDLPQSATLDMPLGAAAEPVKGCKDASGEMTLGSEEAIDLPSMAVRDEDPARSNSVTVANVDTTRCLPQALSGFGPFRPKFARTGACFAA